MKTISASNWAAICLAWASMQFGTLAYALNVEVEGTAPITDNAPAKARVFAVQNAIRQAAMQHSVEVSSTTTLSNHAVTGDSARLRSLGRVSNVNVTDEWTEDGLYHVLIRAEVEMKHASEPITQGYRKKTAFTQLLMRDRSAAADIPYIEMELPRQLRKEMESRYGVIGVDVTQSVLAEPTATAYEQRTVPGRELVARVAKEWGVQFIVAGILLDTGITNDTLGKSRRFEVEMLLFDGISGTLLARSHYNDVVVGVDPVPSGTTTASAEFLTSNYGRTIMQVIQRAAGNLSADIDRLPFSARVIRCEAKKVYFDAGTIAAVRVGDMLMAYKIGHEKITDPANGGFLGFSEQPVATLVVKNVQPQFAVAEMESEEVVLRPGDMVRFGW